MKNHQRGFSAIEIILVLVFFAAIGGGIYYVMNKTKTKTTSSPATTTTAKKTASQTWTAGGPVISGTYADADAIKVSDGKYRLYYATQPETGNLVVYSSTSSDGKTWTREAGTRKSMATFPDVIKLSDGRFRMYFQSAGVIKSAISSDGLSFTDEAGTRVDKTNSAGLTFDNVAAPSVLAMKDGSFVMVYRGTINSRYAGDVPTPNPTTQVLMTATSSDGLTFTGKGLAVDSRNATLYGQLDGPDLVKWDDGKYKLFATSYTGVYEFSFDGQKFGSPTLALAGEAKKTAQGFQGSPPGDPSVIQIGKTWFMYYGGPRDQNGIHYATLK